MLKEESNISTLIAKFLTKCINEEEIAELEFWRNNSVDNGILFEKLCASHHLELHREKAEKYNRMEGWKAIEQQIRHKRMTNSIMKWTAYAAAIILPLTIGCLLIWNTPHECPQVATNQSENIVPGSSKATLTLANGSVVDLEAAETFELQEENGTTIKKESSILNYQTVASNKEVVYNRIEIPRGGEYTLKLSDGTVVYLNAMSSLRFPVHFSGNSREVELQGEAFFEVAKKNEPFIVKTGHMNIEVLGTVFNISCYAEDQVARATLVSGSVKVTSSVLQSPMVLKPSQQASFNKTSNQISVRDVDVEQYIAWKSSHFYFKDWRLEDIMIYLSRWYDIDVFYQNEAIKDLKFGCNLNRYGEITSVLDLFEQTGQIKACIKGKTIVLSNK